MYVEAMSQAMAGKTMVTSKTVTAPDTDSMAKVESTEGDTLVNRQSQKIYFNTAQSPETDDDSITGEEKQAGDNEKIKKAIEKMNAQLPNSEVKFGIHEKTDRVTIKLVDKDTKEVIKEFPPEKTLDMIAKCMELAGVLVDEKL